MHKRHFLWNTQARACACMFVCLSVCLCLPMWISLSVCHCLSVCVRMHACVSGCLVARSPLPQRRCCQCRWRWTIILLMVVSKSISSLSFLPSTSCSLSASMSHFSCLSEAPQERRVYWHSSLLHPPVQAYPPANNHLRLSLDSYKLFPVRMLNIPITFYKTVVHDTTRIIYTTLSLSPSPPSHKVAGYLQAPISLCGPCHPNTVAWEERIVWK